MYTRTWIYNVWLSESLTKLMLQIRLTWNNFLGKPVNNLKICKNIMVLYTCVHGKCTWIIYLMLTRINSSNWRYCSQNWGEVPNSTSRKRYWDWTKRGVSTIHLAPTASDRCFCIALLRTQRSSASSKEDPWSSNQHSSKLVIQRTRKDYQCGVCKTFPLFQNQRMRRVVLFLVPFLR